jgi:thioesterase domain-containing protein
MIDSSGSQKIEILTTVWKRLLHRTAISTEDNFFDIGGDRSSAERLFTEIAAVYGRELSPLLIYRAPTIAALAALLSQEGPITVPPLLLLNATTQGPPLFIAHGLGDTVMGFSELVRRMRVAHPIYGMQARGVDGLTEPFDNIEDMAQYHLEAIQRLQPRGPYFLTGYSLGGLIALEIAQRLSKNGEKIGLLAMLDSYPDRHHLSLAQRARLDWRLAKQRITSFMRVDERRRRNAVAKVISPYARNQVESLRSIARAMYQVKDEQYRALRNYRPRFYEGKVKFVKAAINPYHPEDPVAVWGHLIRQFELATVPGEHVEMLTTQVGCVASLLERYVEQALSECQRNPL